VIAKTHPELFLWSATVEKWSVRQAVKIHRRFQVVVKTEEQKIDDIQRIAAVVPHLKKAARCTGTDSQARVWLSCWHR